MNRDAFWDTFLTASSWILKNVRVFDDILNEVQQ